MRYDQLFANHLFFMANHRGSVRLEGVDLHLCGPIDELTSYVPGSPLSPLPDDCRAVRLAPWSGDWNERLESARFRPAEALSYMELADADRALSENRAIEVRIVRNADEAEEFARVQAEGFATGGSGDDWWKAYFSAQARRNFDHSLQTFYLGCSGGTPCTSTLVCNAAGVTGVYAVATKPEFRRQGASAAVLEQARRNAVAAGSPRLVLQAVAGGHAESYYAKLGFFKRYTSQIWRR